MRVPTHVASTTHPQFVEVGPEGPPPRLLLSPRFPPPGQDLPKALLPCLCAPLTLNLTLGPLGPRQALGKAKASSCPSSCPSPASVIMTAVIRTPAHTLRPVLPCPCTMGPSSCPIYNGHSCRKPGGKALLLPSCALLLRAPSLCTCELAAPP